MPQNTQGTDKGGKIKGKSGDRIVLGRAKDPGGNLADQVRPVGAPDPDAAKKASPPKGDTPAESPKGNDSATPKGKAKPRPKPTAPVPAQGAGDGSEGAAPGAAPSPALSPSPLPPFGEVVDRAGSTAPARATPVAEHLNALEIQASIYSVLGLPEVFTEADLVAKASTPIMGGMEIADADAFLGTMTYLEASWTLHKDGQKDLHGKATWKRGWFQVNVPAAYDGGVLHVQSTRPVIAYYTTPVELALYTSNRVRVIRELVAPKTSKRRVTMIRRAFVREDALPNDPKSITEHPETATVLKDFIKRAAEVPN